MIPILTSAPTADTHNNIKIKANNGFVSLLIMMVVIPPSFIGDSRYQARLEPTMVLSVKTVVVLKDNCSLGLERVSCPQILSNRCKSRSFAFKFKGNNALETKPSLSYVQLASDFRN